MKHKNPKSSLLFNSLTACPAIVIAVFAQSAFATSFTWDGAPDGGGSSADAKWSTATNWVGDAAPGATGNTLTFGGTTNLSAVNDSLTALATSGTAITFDSGAGSFNLGGSALTVGSGGGGGQVIIQQNSANNQTISLNLNFTGGSGDRSIVFGSGAGSLTLSGNINFSNDWLFPTTTAGTIILSGNNTGDGKAYNAGGVTAGTNTMNAMMRNNVAGTQLVLGSDTALGNSGSGNASAGTASFRGIVANQQLNISTTGGDRNLSGSSLAINANNITFNGANNLTVGNLVTVGGNRDFVVSSTGAVTVSSGIFLSQDQTGRQLYVNLSGAGGMVVNGQIYDTFHSGGLTSAGSGLFRKAGTGSMTLNGDNSSTLASPITIEGGTLKIGHANALGATGASSGTTLTGNATLDLNGFAIGETLTFNNSGNKLVNSSATAAVISADAALNTNITVDATGDITAARLIGSATRTVTKLGAGTLTTNGTSHNNLCAWDIQVGNVVFANTSGYGADRGVTLNGGTLQLSGANSNLINDAEAFTINSGTFDLNGKAEAVASIGGAGGTITNSSASACTLYVGGGPSGTSTASFSGAIQDGTGVLNLVKEGSGTQTLTGTLAYTGNTTVSQTGTLSINSASLNDSSTVTIGASAFLNLDYSGTDVIGALVLGGVTQPDGIYDSTNSGGLITGTGKLQVGAAAGYSSWASTYAPGQTPSEDYDNDGVSNGVEYFMGVTALGFTSNPSVVSGKVTWTNGGNIDSSAYGTQFVVQTSTNLTSWTNVDSGDANLSNTSGSVAYTLPTGSPKLFVRLVVTPN